LDGGLYRQADDIATGERLTILDEIGDSYYLNYVSDSGNARGGAIGSDIGGGNGGGGSSGLFGGSEGEFVLHNLP
jgi:hypothetical protein